MSEIRETKSCKLCHGVMYSSRHVKPQIISLGFTTTPATTEDCHANCASFACPGCVAKHRDSYAILNMKNHIYDYHCSNCMAEVQLHTSRRGSAQSDTGSAGSDQGF